MSNHLANETSPYLLQHATNPVDWYPWGEEALSRARAEDKPILLSIGYSACHWCHVMERESFEDPATAHLMNRDFVNIKVDREERPDLDTIYMEAVQTMTGQGGWPMTVFLTPQGRPFFGGTYFPPDDHPGMPSFERVLHHVVTAYQGDRERVVDSAEALGAELGRSPFMAAQENPDELVAEEAYTRLAATFDAENGGFGGAPKFPQPTTLEFLLRYYRRTGRAHALKMVTLTLDHLCHGGIVDQLGGGFHRYSTDSVWLVPHFEKMLYDNALLARVLLEAFQVTRNAEYRRVAEETLLFMEKSLLSPEGGFYTALDADSEGEEGVYYLWTRDEIAMIVGDDGPLVADLLGVSHSGNMADTPIKGSSVLSRMTPLETVAAGHGLSEKGVEEALEKARKPLIVAREQRVQPQRDEKILTAWNGLALRAFAEAARVLDREDFERIAVRNADFLLRAVRREGRLLRTYRDGTARHNGYLDDYASLILGLLSLYSTTFEPSLFVAARDLATTMIDHFWDATDGGFFNTSDDHETLVSRPKDPFDNALPSGNSLAVEALVHLWALTGDRHLKSLVEQTLRGLATAMRRVPGGFGRLLAVLEETLSGPVQLAIAGEREAPETKRLLDVLRDGYYPEVIAAVTAPEAVESGIRLLEDRPKIDGCATAYLCHHFTCLLPITNASDLAHELASTGTGATKYTLTTDPAEEHQARSESSAQSAT